MIQLACNQPDSHIEDILSSPASSVESASNENDPVDVQDNDKTTSDYSQHVETPLPVNESAMVDPEEENI